VVVALSLYLLVPGPTKADISKFWGAPKNGNKKRNVLIILLTSSLTRDGKFSLSSFSLCFYCFICYECTITPKILDGFNRSDVAWKDAKNAQIWEYLRDEFELTQRFASLYLKLKFVEVLSLF